MARSQIIKDIANSSIDTVTALKRAKVLFSELGNSNLLKWVNNEITGYTEDSSLPDYRKMKGNLIGSYFKGSIATHMKWNGVSLPLGNMPDELKESLLSVYIFDGIDGIKKLLEKDDESDEGVIAKPIPADFFPTISHYNNDRFMMITSAQVEIGAHNLLNIISIVENRLLDALLVLEKEFGNLDDLDIDISGKSSAEIEEIANKITVLVYNDNRVTIGDGNKINDSSINSLGK